jgi:hypothetical protein
MDRSINFHMALSAMNYLLTVSFRQFSLYIILKGFVLLEGNLSVLIKLPTFHRSLTSFISCGSFFRVVVFNATFNNISVILWRSVLLVEETGVPGENHRPAASH